MNRHYQCYEIKPFAFGRKPADVQDRYADATDTLATPNRLCAPSSKQIGKNSVEDPNAKDDPDHLMAFPSSSTTSRITNQVVHNQFGTVTLDLIRRSFLLVPTAKNLQEAPSPLTNPIDHFQCYLVRRSAGTPPFAKIPGITGVDQFGLQGFDILRPRYLCAPASKNDEDPAAINHTNNLLCYKARHRVNFPTFEPHVNNQFLQNEVTLTRRMEFCVPSTIGVGD